MWKEEKTGGPGCGKRITQEPSAVDGFPETRGRFAGLLEMGRFLPERAARVSGDRGMRRARRVEALIRRASPFSSALLVPLAARLRAKLACERGQGTTEYAILVGVQVKEDNQLPTREEILDGEVLGVAAGAELHSLAHLRRRSLLQDNMKPYILLIDMLGEILVLDALDERAERLVLGLG